MAALRLLALCLWLLNLPAMACPDYLIDEALLVNILKSNITGSLLSNPSVTIAPDETCSIKMAANTLFGEATACTHPVHENFSVGLAAFSVEIAGQQIPVAASLVDIRADIKKHCNKELKIRELKTTKGQVRIIFVAPP